MAEFPAFGAAREFIAQDLGGPTSEAESTVATGANAVSICGNDPDAVGLTIVNVGAQNVFIGLTQGVSATNGIFLGANGGLVTMSVKDDYTLPTREWFAVSPAGASTVYVLRQRRFTASRSGG